MGEVGKLAERYSGTDCFCTCFLFDQGLPEYAKGNRHSVTGYRGPCYAQYLPLDIDSPDLGAALETTRETPQPR